MFYIAASFLLISGIAALTYQVTWVRLLGLSMGSTSASISTVLAAFFLGLALGSYLAERITRNRINDLKPYIILELIIGVSGVLLLPTLLNLDALMAALPAWGTALWMKFLIAIVLLVIPTMCMGATFPVMAAIMIRRQGEMGLRMSQLYSLNTAGAVLGACLSGFLFIPMVGLDGSIYIAVFLNLLVVALAFHFNRTHTLPPVELESTPADSGVEPQKAPLQGLALLVLFCTGLVAIATEVGWTKYLVLFAGTTIYGFAAILTIFLIGIATGSWAIKNRIEAMREPQLWLAAGLVLLGLTLLLTRSGLAAVPTIYHGINNMPAPDFVIHLIKYGLVFVLLFIPTFLFGALFPINLKLYCGDLQGIRSRIGKAYAVNTVASIIGSIAAGFWIIPEYGTDTLLTVMAIIILILPLLFVPTLSSSGTRMAVAGLAIVCMLSAWVLPHLDYKKLVASVGYDRSFEVGTEPEFLFLKEGKAGVVSMVTYDDGYARLQNNGLNESIIDLNDEHNLLVSEMLLGLMPYFYHPDPKSAFVVGFGGGITTRALSYTDLDSVRVVELEPAVVDAGRAIAGGSIKALQDERINISFNDARNTLLVEDNTYDIVVAQPSHPWRAGAANVFTQQFFEVVREKLNPAGIFGQWINLFHMDVTTLKALIKSYLNVFPHVVSYANLNTGDLLLYGSNAPLVFDDELVAKRFKLPGVKKALANHELHNPDDLFWYFGLSQAELVQAAGDSVANTDKNILSEVRLSKMVAEATGDEDPYAFLRDNYSLDMISYINADRAEQRMFNVGLYFLKWDSPDITRKAATQLSKLNDIAGRSLEYQVLYRQFRFAEASEFYAKHEQWYDRVHMQQAQIYAEVALWPKADTAAKAIADTGIRGNVQAYLLYEQGKWSELDRFKPQNDYQRQWYLAGQARKNPVKAGKALVALMPQNSDVLHLLKVRLRYFAVINDVEAMEKTARRLATVLSDVSKRMASQAEIALADEELAHLNFLVKRIESMYPEEPKLDDLKVGLTELRGKFAE